MSFAMKTPIDFVIAVALLPDRGNLFSRTSWIFDCPVSVLFLVPGEVFAVFDCNTSDFPSMLCWLFKCALMLELEPGTILESCEANFADSFRLVCCSVFSRKTIIFLHCGSKRSRRIHNRLVIRRHVWERDNEHAHGLPYWKFSRGGRGATFLPSNMAQELQVSVFDRLSMKNAHLIEIWILSLQYIDSLRALLERYAKNRTKIETWNQIIVNRTERS